MFGQRLRQLRLARGFTLEALSAEMGGIVTKQALLKYEQSKSNPSPTVVQKLAVALGVKAIHLWSEPPVQVQFVAYRKGSRLRKREQERVESFVSHTLEQRCRLQELSGRIDGSQLPIQAFRVKTMDDAESAATDLRTQWRLGSDPIASLTGVLEDHWIHVVEIDADEKFDGIAAVAHGEENHIKSAIVVTRRGVSGERQRLNCAHELGHLVLKVSKNVDEEKAAFRFGSAFLAPAEMLYQEVGNKRAFIQLEELFLLKRRFGMSMQALLHRLHDLAVITDSYYRQWCIDINRWGWRRQEPNEITREKPQWLNQNVLRALAEGLITHEQAEALLGKPIESPRPLSLTQRRAFAKLPIEERRQVLAEQAEKMVAFYKQNPEGF